MSRIASRPTAANRPARRRRMSDESIAAMSTTDLRDMVRDWAWNYPAEVDAARSELTRRAAALSDETDTYVSPAALAAPSGVDWEAALCTPYSEPRPYYPAAFRGVSALQVALTAAGV